jgi:hypothetical protein
MMHWRRPVFILPKALFLWLCIGLFAEGWAQFEERSALVGVNHEYRQLLLIGGGVVIADFNNDNLPDLFFTGGKLPDQFYVNNGAGFDRIFSYLDPEDFDYLNYQVTSAAAGDVNNDGLDDLLLCTERQYENILLINNGNNSFDAIPPEDSGITGKYWSLGASFGDVNEDGLLDIFIQNYTETGQVSIDTSDGTTVFEHIGYQNNLFINRGNAVFEDASADYNLVKKGNSLSSAFTDYDNDGDMDIYVINDFGEDTEPNELYRNEYPSLMLTDVSEPSGADIGLFGMGVAIGDYDADLDLDYYVTNLGKNSLLQYNGDGTFTDVTSQAGVGDSAQTEGLAVGWGTGFMDYDNDGDLDLYVANGYIPSAEELSNPIINPSKFFSNNGDGTFTDRTTELDFGVPAVNRGSAFGDLNNDGKLDIIMVPVTCCPSPLDPALDRTATIFYNVTENGNNWIKFRLEGIQSNRNGYGARLILYDNSGRVQVRESDGGSSHCSSNSSFIHFGLGPADKVDSLIIHWPSGLQEKITEPVINNLSIVREGEGAEPVLTYSSPDQAQKISLYPNPAVDHITIDLSAWRTGNDISRFSIYTVNGMRILGGKVKASVNHLDISGLPAGTYRLEVTDASGRTAAGRFIKAGR